MSKKAQSQIITTVLIILLVLAAIVIVWQVVNTTIRGGAEQVETQSACLGLNLVVESASAASDQVLVRRDPGAPDQIDVDFIIFVSGANSNTVDANLNELGSNLSTATTDIATTDYVQVAPKLASGTLCPLGSKKDASA